MIKEMNALVAELKENGGYDRREARLKLAAAEWLLVNDSRMMIEDPEDPLNPIPNRGNRYWKTLTKTRDALAIEKLNCLIARKTQIPIILILLIFYRTNFQTERTTESG